MNSGRQGEQCRNCVHYEKIDTGGGRQKGNCSTHGLQTWATGRPLATNCYKKRTR